jgi:hypothetical protein
MIPAIVLGAMLLGGAPAEAYFCPGDPTNYQTTCIGMSNGTPCIAPFNNLGCCGPGICQSQVCDLPQMQTACDDENTCTTDICTTAGGGNFDPICTFDPVDDGTPCDADDNECTLDSCDGGTCTFDADKDCSGVNLPHPGCQEPACNPNNGNCFAAATNEGERCNDGFDCTYGERCDNGACGGNGNGFLRPANTPCWDGEFCKPGKCNGSDRACKNKTNLPAGTACDPNNCTNATCQSNGGPCVVNSCNSSALCEQCGNVQCQGATQNPAFPCGCVTQPIYNPPN